MGYELLSSPWTQPGNQSNLNPRLATDLLFSTYDSGAVDSANDMETALTACQTLATQTGVGKVRLLMDSRSHYKTSTAPRAGTFGQRAQVRLPFQQAQLIWIEIVGMEGGSWSTLPTYPGLAFNISGVPTVGATTTLTLNTVSAVNPFQSAATIVFNTLPGGITGLALATQYTVSATGGSTGAWTVSFTGTTTGGAWTTGGQVTILGIVPGNQGTIWESTYTGGTFAGYGTGLASMFGGPSSFTTAHVADSSGTGGNIWSNTCYSFRNMEFRQPTNPSIAGLDLGFVRSCKIEDCAVDTVQNINGTGFGSFTVPNNPQALGIQLPFVLMDSPVSVDRVDVSGFFAAYGTGEILSGGLLRADSCVLVIASDTGQHPNIIRHMVDNHCINGIGMLDPSVGVVPFLATTAAIASYGSQTNSKNTSGIATQAPIRLERWTINLGWGSGGGGGNSGFARQSDFVDMVATGALDLGGSNPYVYCDDTSYCIPGIAGTPSTGGIASPMPIQLGVPLIATSISPGATTVVTHNYGGATQPVAIGNTITVKAPLGTGTMWGTLTEGTVVTVTAVGGSTGAWTFSFTTPSLAGLTWLTGGIFVLNGLGSHLRLLDRWLTRGFLALHVPASATPEYATGNASGLQLWRDVAITIVGGTGSANVQVDGHAMGFNLATGIIETVIVPSGKKWSLGTYTVAPTISGILL